MLNAVLHEKNCLRTNPHKLNLLADGSNCMTANKMQILAQGLTLNGNSVAHVQRGEDNLIVFQDCESGKILHVQTGNLWFTPQEPIFHTILPNVPKWDTLINRMVKQEKEAIKEWLDTTFEAKVCTSQLTWDDVSQEAYLIRVDECKLWDALWNDPRTVKLTWDNGPTIQLDAVPVEVRQPLKNLKAVVWAAGWMEGVCLRIFGEEVIPAIVAGKPIYTHYRGLELNPIAGPCNMHDWNHWVPVFEALGIKE